MLGLSLGLEIGKASLLAATALAGWTPASLGANLVIWLEPKPANLTKLGGGTPVDGDQVSAIADLSGNGFGFSQATTGHYPIYHTDGTYHWLTFDGTDDGLERASTTITDGSGQHSAVACVKPSTTTGVQRFLDADALVRVSQLLRSNAGTLETIAFNTGPTAFTDAGPSVGSGTVHVVSEVTSTTATEAFVDNSGNGSTAVSGTLQTGASQLYIGQASGGDYYNGNFYGAFIAKGAMGSTDRASAQTYMRALAP